MRRLTFFLLTTLLVVMSVLPAGIGHAALNVAANGYYIPNYFGTVPNWANSPALAKFVDTLPGICGVDGATNQNDQCIPLAEPNQARFGGTSDYYEIELVQYRERMHSDFAALNNADKMLATSGGSLLRGYRQTNTANPDLLAPHYLGPLILATKDRPVRIKFINKLPAGAGGKLFVPVDTTIMGSGQGPSANWILPSDQVCSSATNSATPAACFTENRANLHLHGGRTPWISDGTPHQWIIPGVDGNAKKQGASVVNVPDMWFDSGNIQADGTYASISACDGMTTCAEPNATNDPGPGAQTYYYTNQQSARFLFYHDHAWGITRLNVYIGMAAGYLIKDAKEEALIEAGTIPGDQPAWPAQYRYGIPLVIQDKTFVDAAGTTGTNQNHVMNTDPTWAWGSVPGKPVTPTPTTGDLWWPHVYMPAQNPYNPDFSGVNPMGRWVYGPWFWPPTTNIEYGPVPNPYANPLHSEYSESQPPEMPGTPNPSWGAEAFLDTMVVNGTAFPTVTVAPQAYRFRILNAAHDRFVNLQFYRAVSKNGYTNPTVAPYVFTGDPTDLTEVAMVPAQATAGFPELWPTDGREGGVPDPVTRGPAFIQIGNEAGFLPKPVVLPNQPINWNVDPTLFTAGLVLQQNQGGGTLQLGPAERADVVVDFSAFAGHTLILYNDAPAPWPALDPHYDYYTGAPDRRAEMGGANTVLPGVGPNIRTVMQIRVTGTGGAATPDHYTASILTNLQTAFAGAGGVFATSQDPIIAGQTAYDSAYGTTFPAIWPNWGISRITDTSLKFKGVDGVFRTVLMKPKAIQDEMGEVFDEYGRMSAKLGLELPATTALNQTFVVQNYVDPPTEIVRPNEIQIWKITHNGVDTHPVHFHLFDVQLLNRVGWDGFIYLPDDNELGWKETVKINPLEDTIVALRPIMPRVPFQVPSSVRPLNPAMPIGTTMGFTNIDPLTAQAINPPVTNQLARFGHEYVWHCHILSHEESDMMRPVVLNTNTKNDFNNDINSDIVWRNTATGENRVWYMKGVIRDSAASIRTATSAQWTIVGTGDFNDDWKPDIVWRNTATGANVVWFMDGATYTTSVALRTVADTQWALVGVGDFNADGKPDLLWRHTGTGANVVWYMNGVTYVSSVALPTEADTDWTIVGVGDFNDDGKPDIAWRNATTGDNQAWYMDGVTRTGTAAIRSVPNAQWVIAGVSDFNGDGKSDLLWRNTVSGVNVVWYMNGVTYTTSVALDTEADLNWTIAGR
ncbi:MAG: FG-GAP-like repeat-containing protein [Syntrophales bacterium]